MKIYFIVNVKVDYCVLVCLHGKLDFEVKIVHSLIFMYFGVEWRVGVRILGIIGGFGVCILRLFGWLVCVLFACLVDLHVYPSHISSWLLCGRGACANGLIGCTNNNYASRETCKKCGQPKEVAAMPAIAISGASVTTHPTYFARAQGGLEQKLRNGLFANGALQHQPPLNSNWSLVGSSQYVGNTSGILYPRPANQLLPAPNTWRSGDWICTCGFHNYASRAQCKKCNASMPPAVSVPLASSGSSAHGTKRLASEEFGLDWDNKRLNAGHTLGLQQGFESIGNFGSSQPPSFQPTFPSQSSVVAPNFQLNLQVPRVLPVPVIFGKGAKQWRDGDWMCSNCNNHNYASRSQCNRCKTQREVVAQPVSIA